MARANPAEGERYYERLLLNHVRGPKSFEHLMSVGDEQCQSFKEAAQKMGLLESDDSIIECLDEATSYKMPTEFRRLFATILVHCEPLEVRKLWDLYFEAMSDDFSRDYGNSYKIIEQYVLRGIEEYLTSMGRCISSYDLPVPKDREMGAMTRMEKEIHEEMSIPISNKDREARHRLNEEQKHAFNLIIDIVDNKKCGIFFVDGHGGTGKTYLYRALLAEIRSKGLIVVATMSLGVVASILHGGRTAYSRFNIPLQTNESSICNISKQSGRVKLIRKARLIIWDEAPMSKRTTIATVDRTFKDTMNSEKSFAGKVMVLGGDFRQVLPVVPKATR